MYFNEEIETIKRSDLKGLQNKKLVKTLEAASKTSFYSSVIKENNINISEIDTIDKMNKFPFTTKIDLRTSYPHGMVAVDKSDIVRMHASSGTTGKPTVIFYTQKDINDWADLIARCMMATGATRDDVFQNMMGYGLFTGGLGLHYGAERLGCMVIPSSSGNSLKQLQLMRDFDTGIIHITPSYALHLVELIERQGVDPHELSVKKAYLGAEPYSLGIKKKIEEQWGLDAYDSYGLSEMNGPGVAFECIYKDGMHIWEDFYIVEIVDPDSGDPVPDGEEGELVLTHLNREAMPMIRYTTRDLTRIIPEACPCGRTHKRIERIKGRTDDMLIVGGVNVFPSQIESVLMKISEVGNNYQIILNRENNLDRMRIKVELNTKMTDGDVSASGMENLNKKIVEELKALIVINPKVELLEPGKLPASTGKAVRVIDNRKI